MIHLTPDVQDLIGRALSEDLAFHDTTTSILVPPDLNGVGVIKSKADGVLAGIDVCLEVFRRVDPQIKTHTLLKDGAALGMGQKVGRVEGNVSSILQAERVALNFLQRMSGIATATAAYVKAVEGCKAQIVDTRKTVPGFRYLDKYAVRAGGGANHRLNLVDGILIKDNHIAAIRSRGVGLIEAVRLALKNAPHTAKVEVEVTNREELEAALEAGAHIIMLDNMSHEEMRSSVEVVNGRAVIEASGGIDLENARAVAETGVDIISIGALTHSVKALDMSLDLDL